MRLAGIQDGIDDRIGPPHGKISRFTIAIDQYESTFTDLDETEFVTSRRDHSGIGAEAFDFGFEAPIDLEQNGEFLTAILEILALIPPGL